MNDQSAVDSLAALAQETRLKIFRLLVQKAPPPLPAGEIARRLKLPGPTLSFHLNILAATELIESQRTGRSISYAPNFQNVNRLMNYLMENCCGGEGCSIDLTKPSKKSRSK
jgi:ArsR family transcriptional regulator, arsenate/arsenite/antimonite-responsive transcriptional repressor